MHAPEAESLGQLARGVDQFGPGFDAVDVPPGAGLEVQVVEDETEVGLARAVVDEDWIFVVGVGLVEQRLDELVEVVDLFEFAPGILV